MKDEWKEVVTDYLFDNLILFLREAEKHHDKPVSIARNLAWT